MVLQREDFEFGGVAMSEAAGPFSRETARIAQEQQGGS